MALPPLDIRVVTAFELHHDVQLPPAWLSLLALQNGGPIRYDAFPLGHTAFLPDGFLHIPHLRGIGPGAGIVNARTLNLPFPTPDGLLVLCADESWVVGFDYTAPPEPLDPPVVFVDASGLIELAADVATFVRSLVRSDRDFLLGILPADEDDVDDVPDLVHEALEEFAPAFTARGEEDMTWLWQHTSWRSRHGAEPASLFLRTIAGTDDDDPEFPLHPRIHWVLEADMAPENVRWLEQQLARSDVRSTRLHTPVIPGVPMELTR
jgi:hypothetical protein